MAPPDVEFKPGDRVVYPNQGVCRITRFEEMEISGERHVFMTMSREEDGATVRVPRHKAKANGIRKVATAAELKRVFALLVQPSAGPELDWKIRHRAHGEKLAAGDIRSVAEVVKALQALSEIRPLPTKERETYDNARHLLVREISVALGLGEVSAEDAVDLALYPPGVERKKPVLKVAPPPADADSAAAADLVDDDELDAELPEDGAPAEAEAEADASTEVEAAKPTCDQGARPKAAPVPLKAAPKPPKPAPARKAPAKKLQPRRAPAGRAKKSKRGRA